MTPERRKSIIALTATLILGIVLGLLIPAAYHLTVKRDRTNFAMRRDRIHKDKWFVGTLERVIRPDSAQAKQLKPITDWAAAQIDSIEQSANQQMTFVLDSVKSQIKPIITEEQQERLDRFKERAQSHWGPPRHRGGPREWHN